MPPKRVSRQQGYQSKRNISGSTALASTTSVGAGQVTPPEDKRMQILGQTQANIAAHFVKADQVDQLGRARTDLFSKRMEYMKRIQQDDPNNWRNWEAGYDEMMTDAKQAHSSALPAVLAGEFDKTFTGINETGKGSVATFARNTQITTTLANFSREEDVYAQAGIYADDYLGREEAMAEYTERVQNLVSSGFISAEKAKERVEGFNYKVTEGRINRLVFEDLDQDPLVRYEKLKRLHHDITIRSREQNTHGLKEDRRTYWERVIWGEMGKAAEVDRGRNKVLKERYRHNELKMVLDFKKGIADGSMLDPAFLENYKEHVRVQLDGPEHRADLYGSSYGNTSANNIAELTELRNAAVKKIETNTLLIDGISDAVNTGDTKKLQKFMASAPTDKRQGFVSAAYRSSVLKATVNPNDGEAMADVDAYVSAIVDGDTLRMGTLEKKLSAKYDINNPDVKRAMLSFLDVLPGNVLPFDIVTGLDAGLATPKTAVAQLSLYRDLSSGQKSALNKDTFAAYEIFDTLMSVSDNPEAAYAAAMNKDISPLDLKSRREHLDNKYKEDGGVFGVTEDYLDGQFKKGWYMPGKSNPFENPAHQRVFQQLFLRHFDSIQDKDKALDSAWRQFSANVGDVNGAPFVHAPNVMYRGRNESKGYVDMWIDEDMKATVVEMTGYRGDLDKLRIIRAVTDPRPGYPDASSAAPIYEILAENGTAFIGKNAQTLYYRPDRERYMARDKSETFPDYTRRLKAEMLERTNAFGNLPGS